MPKPLHFRIKFDGYGLREGAINARDLSPALLALADLVDHASLRVNGSTAKISLRVHSDFKRGSFEIDLSLLLTYKEQLVDLFSSREAQALSAIFTLLGISGVGLLQAIKVSKGRKPSRVVTIEKTERVRIEFDGDDNIEIPEKAYELFNDSATRQAVNALVEPLTSDGIEELIIQTGESEKFEINESQAAYFIPPDSLENEIISDNDRYVKIVMMSFKPENKWRVHDGSSTIYVSLDDPVFVAKVQSREEVFGSGDHLKVTLRTRQWRENGEIKSSHSITHVKEHIVHEHGRQLRLDEDEN